MRSGKLNDKYRTKFSYLNEFHILKSSSILIGLSTGLLASTSALFYILFNKKSNDSEAQSLFNKELSIKKNNLFDYEDIEIKNVLSDVTKREEKLTKKLQNKEPNYIIANNIENYSSLPRYHSALMLIKYANMHPSKLNNKRVLDELEKLSDYHTLSSIRINIKSLENSKYATKLDDLIKLKINKNYDKINPFLDHGLATYISQLLNDDLMLELAFKKPNVDPRFMRTEPPTTILKLNKILNRNKESASSPNQNVYDDNDYALIFEFYDNVLKLYKENQKLNNNKLRFYSSASTNDLNGLIQKLNKEVSSLLLSDYLASLNKNRTNAHDIWNDSYFDDLLDEEIDVDSMLEEATNSTKISKEAKNLKQKLKYDFIERNELLILKIIETMTKLSPMEFVQLGGMEFLLLIYEKHKYEETYLSAIGNCLCLISLEDDVQRLFIQSGWLKRLNKMLNRKKNDQLDDNINTIRELISHRILFNLISNKNLSHKDSMLYSTEVFPLFPCYTAALNQKESFLESYNVNKTKKEVDIIHNHDVDVIFIHGLRGALWRTWRQDDKLFIPTNENESEISNILTEESKTNLTSKIFDNTFIKNLNRLVEVNINENRRFHTLWPKEWLPIDLSEMQKNESVRILGINYDSTYSMWGQDVIDEKKLKFSIKHRAIDLIDQLILANVGARPIIWVCHSMGGLIVKQMLVELNEISKNRKNGKHSLDVDILNKTKGIVFLSTPHLGSNIAKTATKFSFALNPSPEVFDLASNSPFLVDLNKKFINLVKSSNLKENLKLLSLCENLPTYIGYFNIYAKTVSEQSANALEGLDEFEIIAYKDHLNICKPDDRNCIVYKKILKLIVDYMESENLNCQTCKDDLEMQKHIVLDEYFYDFFKSAHNFHY